MRGGPTGGGGSPEASEGDDGQKRGRLPVGGNRSTPGSIRAGDTFVLPGVDRGDVVRVVWVNPESEGDGDEGLSLPRENDCDPVGPRVVINRYTVPEREGT